MFCFMRSTFSFYSIHFICTNSIKSLLYISFIQKYTLNNVKQIYILVVFLKYKKCKMKLMKLKQRSSDSYKRPNCQDLDCTYANNHKSNINMSCDLVFIEFKELTNNFVYNTQRQITNTKSNPIQVY